MNRAILGSLCLFLSACASPIIEVRNGQSTTCSSPQVTLSADFPGGAIHGCNVISETEFEVFIRPEDYPINPSPWYAFTVAADPLVNITVHLTYVGGQHRYRPKISNDGKHWRYMDSENVERSEDDQRVTLAVTGRGEPLFVTGQELIVSEDYDRWMNGISSHEDVTLDEIGRSREDAPIWRLQTNAASPAGTVVLVGRQHPPELTGALAMLRFVEEVLGDSALAVRFRQRFNLQIVPLMNPDGVDEGHWRHNTGGTDLNRDWGPFIQPETQAVKRMLDTLAVSKQTQPVFFLDFHSTNRNIFYTQMKGLDGTDYGLTANWLQQSAARLTDYTFERGERHQSELATSKNYMHGRFGIPAITYEVGDNTDRRALAQAASVFAEEMMSLLLLHHPRANP